MHGNGINLFQHFKKNVECDGAAKKPPPKNKTTLTFSPAPPRKQKPPKTFIKSSTLPVPSLLSPPGTTFSPLLFEGEEKELTLQCVPACRCAPLPLPCQPAAIEAYLPPCPNKSLHSSRVGMGWESFSRGGWVSSSSCPPQPIPSPS